MFKVRKNAAPVCWKKKWKGGKENGLKHNLMVFFSLTRSLSTPIVPYLLDNLVGATGENHFAHHRVFPIVISWSAMHAEESSVCQAYVNHVSTFQYVRWANATFNVRTARVNKYQRMDAASAWYFIRISFFVPTTFNIFNPCLFF